MPRKKVNVENAIERITEIVSLLESGELSLDDSIKLYREGMELSHFCDGKLKDAEAEIFALCKNDNGKIEKTLFDEQIDIEIGEL